MNRRWDIIFFFTFPFIALSALFYLFRQRLVLSFFSASFCLTHFLLFGGEAGLCLSTDHNANFWFCHNFLYFRLSFWKFFFFFLMGYFLKKKVPYTWALIYGKCLPKIAIASFLFRDTALRHILHERHLQRRLISEFFWDHYHCSLNLRKVSTNIFLS